VLCELYALVVLQISLHCVFTFFLAVIELIVDASFVRRFGLFLLKLFLLVRLPSTFVLLVRFAIHT
jgi:hypothetical protein